MSWVPANRILQMGLARCLQRPRLLALPARRIFIQAANLITLPQGQGGEEIMI